MGEADPHAVFPARKAAKPSARAFVDYLTGGFANGADVTVKDSTRHPETNGWNYYNFNHQEPKAKTASVRPKGECAYCILQAQERTTCGLNSTNAGRHREEVRRIVRRCRRGERLPPAQAPTASQSNVIA